MTSNWRLLEGCVVTHPWSNEDHSFTTFSLAYSKQHNPKQVSYVDVTAFGPTAALCRLFLHKGRRARLLGSFKRCRCVQTDSHPQSTAIMVASLVDFDTVKDASTWIELTRRP